MSDPSIKIMIASKNNLFSFSIHQNRERNNIKTRGSDLNNLPVISFRRKTTYFALA